MSWEAMGERLDRTGGIRGATAHGKDPDFVRWLAALDLLQQELVRSGAVWVKRYTTKAREGGYKTRYSVEFPSYLAWSVAAANAGMPIKFTRRGFVFSQFLFENWG